MLLNSTEELFVMTRIINNMQIRMFTFDDYVKQKTDGEDFSVPSALA